MIRGTIKGDEIPEILKPENVKASVDQASDWAGKISQFCANCALDDKAARMV